MTRYESMIVPAMRMRQAGQEFEEIGVRLGITEEQARYVVRLGERRASAPKTHRTAIKPPLRTSAGVLWKWPPQKTPNNGDERDGVCKTCAVYTECKRMVMAGNFAGCERPLRREIKGQPVKSYKKAIR